MAYPEISSRRLAVMKITFQVMALPAFGLGLAMALAPAGFWNTFGIDIGSDAVVATLYGCVLVGVGLVSMIAIRNPEAHTSVFLFMGIYKGFAFICLTLHFLLHATSQAPAPMAGWVIAILYLLLSAYSFALYPWQNRN